MKHYSPGANLGIGLYIAREVVNAHGGTINVQSAEKEGMTFTVRLPRNMQTVKTSSIPACF